MTKRLQRERQHQSQSRLADSSDLARCQNESNLEWTRNRFEPTSTTQYHGRTLYVPKSPEPDRVAVWPSILIWVPVRSPDATCSRRTCSSSWCRKYHTSKRDYRLRTAGQFSGDDREVPVPPPNRLPRTSRTFGLGSSTSASTATTLDGCGYFTKTLDRRAGIRSPGRAPSDGFAVPGSAASLRMSVGAAMKGGGEEHESEVGPEWEARKRC